MKSKFFTILSALVIAWSGAYGFSPYDDEDEEIEMDQFLMVMGGTGYALWQAMDLAKENHYQYVKILSAEYFVGEEQRGQFTCPLREGADPGKILFFEDEIVKITVSCHGLRPDDSDYIDVESYRDLIHMLEEEDLWFLDQNEDDE